MQADMEELKQAAQEKEAKVKHWLIMLCAFTPCPQKKRPVAFCSIVILIFTIFLHMNYADSCQLSY